MICQMLIPELDAGALQQEEGKRGASARVHDAPYA